MDWLQDCGQSLWQVLPLGPTSYGDSPYQTLSARAGNPLLISLQETVDQGWLASELLDSRPEFAVDRVDFGKAIAWKFGCLDAAWEGFKIKADPQDQKGFAQWQAQQESWLVDFCLYLALKEENAGQPWNQWAADLRDRNPQALKEATERNQDRLQAHAFRQWLFFAQWARLKEYAHERGVGFLGDIPIFVAHDSSDVWARPDLFLLDEKGQPRCVAGVPPDYFSKTGQLWGNPLYDWAQLKEENYQWWVDRVRSTLDQVDLVRIDHFRGFAAYWEVPAGEKTAINGRWVQGPGAHFFTTLKDQLGGQLPVVAEDLGVITPDVEELRDQFHLPGMKVLQFAWSGPDNLFQPHHHVRNSVVYSGTHDNDPTQSWWDDLLDAPTRASIEQYLGSEIKEPHWVLIRMGMLSCARTFIATMQDVLGLGREGRMNLPGEGTGNWNWRMGASALQGEGSRRLATLTALGFRRPDQTPADNSDPSYRPEPSA